MVYYTNELINQLSNYANPMTKIQRMVKNGVLIKLKNGVFEDNKTTNPFYLSSVIYGPSYISFQTALRFYDLIPEKVIAITSATSQKRRTKTFTNYFGHYIYKDVPCNVFSIATKRIIENGYCYTIAEPEKAICDTLYLYSPVSSQKEIENLLFDDLRIDKESFIKLDLMKMKDIAINYHSINLNLLANYLRRTYHEK